MQYIDSDRPDHMPVEARISIFMSLTVGQISRACLWEYEGKGNLFSQVDRELLTKLPFNPYV